MILNLKGILVYILHTYQMQYTFT